MSKGKLLAVSCVWLLMVGLAAVAWRMIWVPKQQQEQSAAEEAEERQRRNQTSAPSAYDVRLNLGLDSFSGYAVFRSDDFKKLLATERIDLNLMDDQADYARRLRDLQSGALQMALFPIDALVVASEQLGKLPATIVAIVDETRGADAMVAYRDAIPDPDALNDPDVRFVLTPASPSEMLVRLMQSQFRLDKLPNDAIVPARDAEDVYQRYRESRPQSKEVFVTWEPYVSRILENEDMVRVIDSSRFKGYIVDCLVVSRDFLIKNPEATDRVLSAYFRSLYDHRDKLTDLVLRDAADLGTAITPQQAAKLVEGIWWKNTLENFEHFGIAGNRLQLLEDMLKNVTRVLVRTKAITRDPTDGRPNELFYIDPLKALQAGNFHPTLSGEAVRDDNIDLPPLGAREWERLVPVGELQVEDLVFARGQSALTDRSLRILDDLAVRLKTYPQYYLLIRGNASRVGNRQANEALAVRRAEAAMEQLIQAGIPASRMQATAIEPTGSSSVSFMLGQPAY